MLSPGMVPVRVTLCPMWSLTEAWLSILYTLPSDTNTAGEPPFTHFCAHSMSSLVAFSCFAAHIESEMVPDQVSANALAEKVRKRAAVARIFFVMGSLAERLLASGR